MLVVGAFRRSVQHCKSCTQATCEARLTSRHAIVIATAAFEVAVMGVLQSENPIVERACVQELRDRMSRNATFISNSSSTQRSAARTSIKFVMAPSWDPERACVPCGANSPPPYASASVPEAERKASEEGVPLRRARKVAVDLRRCGSAASELSSTSTDDEGHTRSSDALGVRNAITSVFDAYCSSLPTAVRDGAYAMLKVPGMLHRARAPHVNWRPLTRRRGFWHPELSGASSLCPLMRGDRRT